MDLRQFFEGFFRLNEELNSFFEESSLINKDIFGGGGDQQDSQREISPRSLMLKRDSPPDRSTGSLIDLIDRGDNFFRSKTFEKTFNSDLSGGLFEEKIVIRDSEGNEKIITKHSAGGRTTQKEITRKGNQIISEKEVVSDIGDDITQIGFDNNNKDNTGRDNFNSNSQHQQENGSWRFWNWFK